MPDLQIALKIARISLVFRSGDEIRLGNGHDPSDSSSTIAILRGADDAVNAGKSFLSSGSKMWVTKTTAKRTISYAGWAIFDLEIAPHNISGNKHNLKKSA